MKRRKFNLKRESATGIVIGVTGAIIVGHLISMVDGFINRIKNPEAYDIDTGPTASEGMLEGQDDSPNYAEQFKEKGAWQPSGPNGEYQIIDISSHQAYVDVAELKRQGVDGVIIKLFDGFFMDYSSDTLHDLDDQDEGRTVEELIRQCEENDMPYGIYVYSRATTEDMAQKEAVKTLKFLSKFKARPTLPVYYDVEPFAEPLSLENYHGEEDGYLGENQTNAKEFFEQHPDQVIANFKAFADILESQGYYVGIYSNLECGFKKIDPTGELLSDYALWISYYPSIDGIYGFEEVADNPSLAEAWPDAYGRDVGIYQFTENGHVEGVYEGGVLDSLDMSYMYHNYRDVIISNGMNIPMDYSIFENPDFDYTDLISNKNKKSK